MRKQEPAVTFSWRIQEFLNHVMCGACVIIVAAFLVELASGSGKNGVLLIDPAIYRFAFHVVVICAIFQSAIWGFRGKP